MDAIPKKISLSEIKMDFRTSPDNQLIDLSDSKRETEFWNWFEKRAIPLEVCASPDETLINDSNIAGRCYGNSQFITVNTGVDYFEGFAKSKGRYLLHGFNVKNRKVQDYTVLSNTKDFKDWNNNLFSDYCGVKIDREFIERHNGEDLKQNYFNIPPLLESLFIEETTK